MRTPDIQKGDKKRSAPPLGLCSRENGSANCYYLLAH